jgi:uncharacterized protein YqgC (DUF456 family)
MVVVRLIDPLAWNLQIRKVSDAGLDCMSETLEMKQCTGGKATTVCVCVCMMMGFLFTPQFLAPLLSAMASYICRLSRRCSVHASS